jgi:hypothetical protein
MGRRCEKCRPTVFSIMIKKKIWTACCTYIYWDIDIRHFLYLPVTPVSLAPVVHLSLYLYELLKTKIVIKLLANRTIGGLGDDESEKTRDTVPLRIPG